MGRYRGVPFEFPIILLRLLRSPRRAGGRTNKMMNLNNNYKSNERALADLLGQLVRGRNTSPTGFSRGGGGGGGGRGGSGVNGGGGPINNYGDSSIGPRSSGGGGGWGGNAPNDWTQGGGGGFGGGGGGGVSGNIMPLMQQGGGMNMNGSGVGFGGMSRGDGMNEGYGGGMSQSGGINDNFGGSFLGMSRGNQGGFGGGGMQSSRGMSSGGGFGGSGYSQSNDDFGRDGFGGAPPAPRSRGMWVSGSTSRSSRNAAPTPTRTRSRPSNQTPSRRRRRSLSGSKAPLPSRSNRSGGASASGNASRSSGQATKRRSDDVPASRGSNAAASAKPARSAEPRKVLTSLGGRWYQHFLGQGLTPQEARKKAFENNNKPFVVSSEGSARKNVKKSRSYATEPYIRIAIYAKGFPENMLDPDDVSSLEELIIDEVANNSTASKLQFERLSRRPGMLIIDCANQHTADWLKEITPKLNWENPELETCNEDDIPDANILIVSLPRSAGQEYDQTLALIQAQNNNLNTDLWEWVHERTDGDRLILTMRVDDDSYNAIRERRFKIFYKFGLIEVNFAHYIRHSLSIKRRREDAAAKKVDKDDKEDETENGVEDEKEETKEEEDIVETTPPSPPPAPVISVED